MNVLLLADRSPSLRYRALTELGGVSADDPEAAELRAAIGASVEVERALATRSDDTAGLAYRLCRLAYLRYDGREVAETAAQLFERQRPDGSWPLWLDERPPAKPRSKRPRQRPRAETYTMVPVQTAFPLRGLAAAGYATDPRAERAYDWLLDQRLDDGAWPGDRKVDLPPSTVPGYRRLSGSDGCRTNTTAALACLALHPERRTSDAASLALRHVLAAAGRAESSLGCEVARLVGLAEPSGRFTYYARVDLAFLLDLASRCGASTDDPWLADVADLVDRRRGPFGLWEHPTHRQLSRWLTLDLETSLQRMATPR